MIAVTRISAALRIARAMAAFASPFARAQTTRIAPDTKAETTYTPTPGFDLSSIDASANPCNDFYAFACGKYAANHLIPRDQAGTDGFYNLYNVNTQELRGILKKASTGSSHTSDDRDEALRTNIVTDSTRLTSFARTAQSSTSLDSPEHSPAPRTPR